MRFTLTLATLAGLLTLAGCGQTPAQPGLLTPQITKGGSADGNAHPYVGLMVAQTADGAPLWRCSGTQMNLTNYLTAGHCTDVQAGAAHVEIWFSEGPVETDPAYLAARGAGQTPAQACQTVRTQGKQGTGYPCVGDVGGRPFVHPDYYTAAFLYHDLGVVVLEREYPNQGYGQLPALNAISDLASQLGLNRVTFTAVGYGLQESYPDAAGWKDVAIRARLAATPKLIQLESEYMILSNNSSTGGTCFGDSGGPNFIGQSNVVGGVTSFGRTSTCAGQGGVYRVDRPDDLEWLATFGLTP